MAVTLDDVRLMKGLKIVHVNIRSLLSNWKEVESTFMDGSLDMVVFTETCLHTNCDYNLFSAQGFKMFRFDRKVKSQSGYSKRGGGGICLFIKDEFDVITWPDMDISNNDIEVYLVSAVNEVI